ncbi:Trafficking protein particle complex subunit 12 [Hondaea fermentalgiana]|uniref:Trafficking protein particle complex subunit 12 n=1 Tax=Hondaea fermentalgiana TaxID=2315210 RepID=A0A2R5GJ00_9STRA|nr:Trafficking protein particle complex subunit 12 [Hondaea fermentalgiana]|eukprot:GBG27844.1 Trafficking protein particle complex subunit 12 [Hondaea fermentalgiana]
MDPSTASSSTGSHGNSAAPASAAGANTALPLSAGGVGDVSGGGGGSIGGTGIGSVGTYSSSHKSSSDIFLSHLPQDERLARVWGKNGTLPKVSTTEELRLELRADLDGSCEENVLFSLCSWAWRGHVEQVLELLQFEEKPFEGEVFRVLRASLLMRLGRQKEATEIVELLQQSRVIAAKVLCAVVAIEWNERSTAVDMLHKLLGQLKQLHCPDPSSPASSTTVLLDTFRKPLLPEAAQAWRQRIMALLVSCYSTSGNYVLALDLCHSALDELGEIEHASDTESLRNAHVPVLLQIGRLRLQMGDFEGARVVLEDLEGDEGLDWNDASAVQVLRGLCDFAEGKMESAKDHFAKLLRQVTGPEAPSEDSANPYVPADMLSAVFAVQEPLAATLANNLALCHLNMCDLDGAIQILEDCIRDNPVRNMHRTLVFNLCTLYDLARSKEQSRQAKLDLQRLAHVLQIGQRFDAQKDLRL